MKRPSPSRSLTLAFYESAMRRSRMPSHIDGQPVCWLYPFDPLKRLCQGKWEAFHFFGRQELRNSQALYGLEQDEVELIEWDDRNAGPGCEAHHRRLDRHATPAFVLPRSALPADTQEFLSERGLESIAERRFPVC